MRAPSCTIDSVLLFNSQDDTGAWIPTKVGVNSWVILQPGKQGSHAKDVKKHGECGYKAKILKFRATGPRSIVSEVLVQHAYMQRHLDASCNLPTRACNYLYLSDFTDWVSPKSILDVIVVVHAEIGEAQRGNQSYKELLQNNVFFYNAKYIPQKSKAGSSNLKMLPLPSFDSSDWPLPDMVTTEAFRARMRQGFWLAMKPTVGSQSTHIQWFIPVHVVVDLFTLTDWRRTPTLFIFKNLNEQSFKSLIDDGWDTKITVGSDIIKCIVDKTSLVFRYHIGRSTLYVNFQYNRLRLLHGSVWENLEEVIVQEGMVKLVCHLVNQQPQLLELEVGSHWTLSSVRQEIIIALGDQENIDEFNMHILEGGQFREKINVRNEQNIVVANILAPKTFQIIFQDLAA